MTKVRDVLVDAELHRHIAAIYMSAWRHITDKFGVAGERHGTISIDGKPTTALSRAVETTTYELLFAANEQNRLVAKLLSANVVEKPGRTRRSTASTHKPGTSRAG